MVAPGTPIEPGEERVLLEVVAGVELTVVELAQMEQNHKRYEPKTEEHMLEYISIQSWKITFLQDEKRWLCEEREKHHDNM